MQTLRSGDALLSYEVRGEGPPVVLLHPFPLNHEFWKGAAEQLSARYRLILPDLRAHGDSELGEGPVTMQKLSADLERVLGEERTGRASFVGVSIGGYLLFEFWRRHRDRVAALVFANTKAGGETLESRATRWQAADRVMREGTAWFIDDMSSKLVSAPTRNNRPDIVEMARNMMRKMSPQDITEVQHGMADRPDSVSTLRDINVPTLLITGEEDTVPLAEIELMRHRIPGSELRIISKAGHYAALEKPEEFGRLLRTFFDGLPNTD